MLDGEKPVSSKRSSDVHWLEGQGVVRPSILVKQQCVV
jgi:hypothetical protein